MLEAFGRVPKGRLFWTLLILYLAVLEAVSFLTSRIPPCIVEAAKYGPEYENQGCPPPHVVFVVTVSSILETIGHDWIIAVSVFVTAIFTGTLWLSTRGMLRATNESLQIANREFVSSHRPEVRLKHIWFVAPDGTPETDIWNGQTLTVRLDIVNIGRTTAFLDFIALLSLVVPRGQRLPPRPPYDNPGVQQFHLNGLQLGGGITFTQAVTDGRVLTQQEVHDIRLGDVLLYYIGVVGYWDDAPGPRRLRQTAFCRYLRFDQIPPRPDDIGRFEKEDDPDYEYQD